MKHRLFEDAEIPDIERQIAGIGPGSRTYDSGPAERAADYMQRKNEIPHDMSNKAYPLEHIDQKLADTLVSIGNIQRLLDIANSNPVLKNKTNEINNLNNKLKDIADLLVDFNEGLSIIKGNE